MASGNRGGEHDNEASAVTEAMATSGTDIKALLAQIADLQKRVDNFENKVDVLPELDDATVPKYRLNSACFLENDTLYFEGDVIGYLGTPNTEMVPLNELARARMQAYVDSLNEAAWQKARLHGRTYIPNVQDFADLMATNLADERRDASEGRFKVSPVQMPVAAALIPPMPHTKEARAQALQSGRPQPSVVVVSAIAGAEAAKVPTNPNTIADKILGRPPNPHRAPPGR